MISVFFAYRIIEKQFGYRQAERLRIIQTLLFLLIVFLHGLIIFGLPAIILLMGISFGVSFIFEIAGTNWGLVFGYYKYTDKSCPLPMIKGVPLCYPIAWCGLVYAGFWQAILLLNPGNITILFLDWKLLLATAALVTLIDIILDPVAVDEGRWIWKKRGGFYGVPFSNFIGWFFTALLIIGLFYLSSGKHLAVATNSNWFTYSPALGYALLLGAGSRPAFERKLYIPGYAGLAAAIILLAVFILKIIV